MGGPPLFNTEIGEGIAKVLPKLEIEPGTQLQGQACYPLSYRFTTCPC